MCTVVLTLLVCFGTTPRPAVASGSVAWPKRLSASAQDRKGKRTERKMFSDPIELDRSKETMKDIYLHFLSFY
jgi:hypothetical protein